MIIQVGTPLREIERDVILQTLASNSGNRTHTARQLGIGIRTLQRKLKLYTKLGFVDETYDYKLGGFVSGGSSGNEQSPQATGTGEEG